MTRIWRAYEAALTVLVIATMVINAVSSVGLGRVPAGLAVPWAVITIAQACVIAGKNRSLRRLQADQTSGREPA